ncbi:MAG TPA: DNA polymerase III subunit alpha [Candidatus Hydromicrobium sp.]
MAFFSHLHVHSEYSLMESTIKIKGLVSAAARNNMKTVALTDKYVMSGAIEFYKEAISKNIKPIIGCEICVRNNRILSHLVILIRNTRGYENLCQIISKSHIERKGLTPVVEISDLKKMDEGLIGLSCCGIGKISSLIREGKMKEALQSITDYRELFGGDFFLEIQRYPKAKGNLCASSLSEILINFAYDNNLPIVATNNVHYLNKEDYRIYKYLSKIKAMGVKNDADIKPIGNDEHYFKSASEMAGMFYDIPGAISNTQLIAERCDLKLSLGNINFPHFKTPGNETEEGYLKKLCYRRGLKWRYGNNPPADVSNRLNKELEIIAKTGFCGYFLTVADIARYAHKNNIPICGKGSSAGSVVSYILGISNIDPVKNNLYFERFLNRERKEPPDIDIDLSNKRRAEIIRYLAARYGKNSISRVCTFSTLKPRAAIREAGRILGWSKEDIDPVIKIDSDPSIYSNRHNIDIGSFTGDSEHADVKNMQYKKITYISRKIESYPRHISMHPSAFVVSSSNLAKKIPLTLSETGEIVSQYDMSSIEDLGLLKIDLINSLSLSLIDDAAEILKSKRNINLNIPEIKYDDKKTFDLIKNGKTLGVFQLESFGIRKLAKKIKPSTLNDITLLISLYRPGPQQSGMIKNFIERKFGREKTTYLHKDLKPILSETYGIILYQEQVMRIAVRIAGYSLGEADNLRKAMTGLSKEEMRNQAARFMRGAARKGYSAGTAGEIFKLMSKFASYGFVKAHAAAYAELSYKTCYIKAHYPAELLSIILTNNSGYYSRAQYIEETRRLDIKIKLPHINKSGSKFSVEDEGKSIRIPLLTVKGLGYISVSSIINERTKNGDFKDFADFYYRISENCRLPEKAIENLIKVGTFDFTGLQRKYLLLACHHLKNLKNIKDVPDRSKCLLLQDKNYLKDFDLEERLEAEEKILGFCASCSPLQYFKSELEQYHTIESGHFPRLISSKKNIFTAGIVIARKIKKSRDGRNMLLCTMEDSDGMYESVFFPDACKKNSKTIMNHSALIIEGMLCFKDGEISVIGKNATSLIGLKRAESRVRRDSIRNILLMETKQAWKI